MNQVTCTSCHRRERWDDSGHHVNLPGGQRRPTEARPLAAWRVIARSISGELGPVVGECAGCGLPLTADLGAALPTWSWRFELPEGIVTADRGSLFSDGAITPDALAARLEQLHKPGWTWRPVTAVLQGGMLTLMFAPVLVWLFALIFTAFFLINFW